MASVLPALVMAQMPKRVMTKHGYQAIFYTPKNGQRPTFEDEVFSDIKVYVGDSLMQASESFAPGGMRTLLPSEEEYNQSQSLPVIVDIALMAGIGDTITAYMRMDSFIRGTLPPRLRKFDAVRYEIKLLRMVDGTERRARTAELRKGAAKTAQAATQTAELYRNGKLDEVQTTASGLKYRMVEKGTLNILQPQDMASVHYYGLLTDGKPFDNSFQRGQPIEFTVGVGQMIPGFDEAVQLMPRGSKAYLFIPPALAYGAQGTPDGVIPPNSEIIFYIEIQ